MADVERGAPRIRPPDARAALLAALRRCSAALERERACHARGSPGAVYASGKRDGLEMAAAMAEAMLWGG